MCKRFRNNSISEQPILSEFVMKREYLMTLALKRDMYRDSRIVIKEVREVNGAAIVAKALGNLSVI